MPHPHPRALTAQRSYPNTAALRFFRWLVIPVMLLTTPTLWSDPMGRFGSLLEAVQTARAPETRDEEVPGNGTPIVSAGDDQNVTEDDVVSLGAAASGFSGNPSITYNWRRVDGPYMIFSDASVANPQFVAPDVASEQQVSLEVTASDGTTTVSDTVVITIAPGGESPLTNAIFNGELSGADYWDAEPKILSAGMGFDNIIGVNEITQGAAREAGGAWYEAVVCTSGQEPSDSNRTSMATAAGVSRVSKGHADFDDGLPIVFSWPVATETADVSDFQFTLNTGEVVFPNSVTLLPNWELNERNTIVAFGAFGNRGRPSESDAVYPVRLDIVEDATPLLLVGPGGQEFNAVGLIWTSPDTTGYGAGPVLVGAKLNVVETVPSGEGGVLLLEQASGALPNDEVALYGEAADFRVRVLTTGGFSPDGITGLHPDDYDDFFRVHARGVNGETVLLESTGQDYAVDGGTLRVLGLSDLGQAVDEGNGIFFDDCYTEERDNYIDIILSGDLAAARSVTHVEIPSLAGGYRAFYNPGGPGPEPFEGIRYTEPGPADLEPVIIAIDDPMRVSRSTQQ